MQQGILSLAAAWLCLGCNPGAFDDTRAAPLENADGGAVFSFPDACAGCGRNDANQINNDAGPSWDNSNAGLRDSLADDWYAPTSDSYVPPADLGSPQPDTNPARTTCSVEVTPRSGNHTTRFSWRTSSNGSACRWKLDGVDIDAIDCNTNGHWEPGQAQTGTHTVTLVVGSGPGGPKECSVTYTHRAEPTDCSINISPRTGDQTTTFDWSVQSTNGTRCGYRLDQGEVHEAPCTWSGQWLPGQARVGRHTITFLVLQAPGGPTECSSSYTRTDTAAFDPSTCSFKPDFIVRSYCAETDDSSAIGVGPFMLNGSDLYYSNGRQFCYFGCWEDTSDPNAPCYVNRIGTELPTNRPACIPRTMGCPGPC